VRASSYPWGLAQSGRRAGPWQKKEKSRRPAASSSAALAKSRPEKRPVGDSAEFRTERVTGDEREDLLLPGGEKLCRSAVRYQQAGQQDVDIKDEAHQGRLARSR
jgi:hypothetical protein